MSHPCLLSGKLYTFGLSTNGQLGLGNRILESSTPHPASQVLEHNQSFPVIILNMTMIMPWWQCCLRWPRYPTSRCRASLAAKVIQPPSVWGDNFIHLEMEGHFLGSFFGQMLKNILGLNRFVYALTFLRHGKLCLDLETTTNHFSPAYVSRSFFSH